MYIGSPSISVQTTWIREMETREMSAMNAVVACVPSKDGGDVGRDKKRPDQFSLHSSNRDKCYPKQLIHGIKVGISLVLVSLLYFLDPLYKQVGENAMWAVMTVIVLFEFFAGATVSKGLNRGMGTVVGGVLGCLASILAEKVGGIGRAITVGTSIFIFGAAASYSRLVPRIKRKYDYGAMIFILTFNLVVVSGLRGEQVIELARERLATISMGFAICMLTSLCIFPMWASDELHSAMATKFDNLANSIEGCMDEYFKVVDEKKENQTITVIDGYKSVLHSKSRDETLANFARWEPWHGKFGFNHPWDKYLCIGDLLRELAASIISLRGCLQSHRQPSSIPLRLYVKEPCEAVASLLARTLRELGNTIIDMRKSRQEDLNVSKLQSMRVQLGEAMLASRELKNCDRFALASLLYLLTEMMGKVEKLAKEVEELGDLAGFCPQ